MGGGREGGRGCKKWGFFATCSSAGGGGVGGGGAWPRQSRTSSPRPQFERLSLLYGEGWSHNFLFRHRRRRHPFLSFPRCTKKSSVLPFLLHPSGGATPTLFVFVAATTLSGRGGHDAGSHSRRTPPTLVTRTDCVDSERSGTKKCLLLPEESPALSPHSSAVAAPVAVLGEAGDQV